MGIQAELLEIGREIVAREPMVPLDDEGRKRQRLFWENTAEFSPGLAMQATFRSPRLAIDNLWEMAFTVVDAGDATETGLTVLAGSRSAKRYETTYDAFVLEAFQQYRHRSGRQTQPAGFYGDWEQRAASTLRPVLRNVDGFVVVGTGALEIVRRNGSTYDNMKNRLSRESLFFNGPKD